MKMPSRTALRAAAVAATPIVVFVLVGPRPLAAAPTWTNTGGDAAWSNPLNWDVGEPDATSDVLLPTPVPAAGGIITLASGELANSLTANADYTLNGGDLTLTTGDVTVGAGATATINSTLTGTANGLTKAGDGTLVLGASGAYSGTTEVNAGTLRLSNDHLLPAGEAVNIGLAASAGTLDLSNASQTVASLNFRSTAAAAVNTVTIGAGKTLLVNGTGSYKQGIPSPFVNGATTNVVISGGGTLRVDNAAGIMDVGIRNVDQNQTPTNTASLNMSGLSSFVANVLELRAGYDSRIGTTLLLSNTANDITATTIHIGNSLANNGSPSSTTLGAGTNVIRADTIRLGQGKVNGTLAFASQAPGSPGTVTIGPNAAAATNFFIGSTEGTGTTANFTGRLDLRGHNATVTAGTIWLGRRNDGSAGSATGEISFDTGTFTATTMNIGHRSSTAASTTVSATGNVNVAGGTFTVGSIDMANKSNTTTANAVGNINVSGGTFTVNTSFRMAIQASTGGSAAGTLNITGGTVDSNVDITRGGGNATATITLDGGVLDMSGRNIGDATNPINVLNLRSGTLRDVAEINGGGAVTKTTPGVLVFNGVNTYTGPTSVADGTLRVMSATGLGAPASTALVDIADAGLLDLRAPSISDLATLQVAGGGEGAPELSLQYAGTDFITGLIVDGVPLGAGVYGSTASGAANPGLANPNNVFDPAALGTLTVGVVPEPGAAATFVALAGLAVRRRGRRA